MFEKGSWPFDTVSHDFNSTFEKSEENTLIGFEKLVVGRMVSNYHMTPDIN